MKETYDLAAEKREQSKHSARDTRAMGRIPGVVYGHGYENQTVSVDYSTFLKLFRRAGQSSLIDLDLDGKKTKVLVQSYDLDPVQDTFQHIDFFAVNLKEKATVHVPLIFEGESPAVKNLGGVFMSNHDEIEVRCLPSDIPHDIKVDISVLANLQDHLCVSDINLPENVEISHMDPESVICSITAHSAGGSDEDAAATEEGAEGEEGEATEEASE